MENEEIWADCPSTNGLLQVSNFARVRSVTRQAFTYERSRLGRIQGNIRPTFQGKVLSQCKTRTGYLEVAVSMNRVRRKYLVHRLVGEAFVPGHFPGAHIDHLDGNKTNNLPSNLEWVTVQENTRRQWETGLVDLRGELAPSAKITNLQAHAVKCLRDNGFPAQAVANWFGISTAAVYKVEKGARHTQSP